MEEKTNKPFAEIYESVVVGLTSIAFHFVGKILLVLAIKYRTQPQRPKKMM